MDPLITKRKSIDEQLSTKIRKISSEDFDKQYIIGEKLGKGSFGEIYKCKDKINDNQLSKCQIITSSINEFKSNFIAKFINQTAMKYLNIELKSSTQYQAGQSEKLIDTAIEEVMLSLMGEMQAAKTYVFDALAK